MNHESSSPRHAAKPTSHRWKAGANAENLSVDSIINRIALERQTEGGRHRKEKIVGSHAVADAASSDSIPARHRPYSFENSYRETLDALNATIERETGKKYSPEDEGLALSKQLDKALDVANEYLSTYPAPTAPENSDYSLANGDHLKDQPDYVSGKAWSNALKEAGLNDRDNAASSEVTSPTDENDAERAVTDDIVNETLAATSLFDNTLEQVDGEEFEPVVARAESSEKKKSIKERIKGIFKRRDSALKRMNLRARSRNVVNSESLSSRISSLKFNTNQLGRRIDSWFKNRQYVSGETIFYNDDRSTLAITREGANVLLGQDAKHPNREHKYARDFTKNGSDMAFILTEDGRRFGLGRGYIMDFNNPDGGRYYYDVHADDSIVLTIGKTGYIPGVGNIGKVVAVELKYKTGQPEHSKKPENVPSPFAEFDEFINQIDTEEAKEALK